MMTVFPSLHSIYLFSYRNYYSIFFQEYYENSCVMMFLQARQQHKILSKLTSRRLLYMNKKFILSIAAAAALLVSTPGMNKAEAAEPVKVQSKVYVYHNSNLNKEQLNEILKKYLNGNLSFSQYTQKRDAIQNEKVTKTEAPKQVQQPTEAKQPAQPTTKQPTQTTQQQAQTEKQPAKTTTATPASSSVSAFSTLR